jgi:hypothetical protein
VRELKLDMSGRSVSLFPHRFRLLTVAGFSSSRSTDKSFSSFDVSYTVASTFPFSALRDLLINYYFTFDRTSSSCSGMSMTRTSFVL